MSKQPFDVPQLTIGRVYTRGGDEGETGLAGGQVRGPGPNCANIPGRQPYDPQG